MTSSPAGTPPADGSPESPVVAEYPLSPLQKGMLFHQMFEPDSGADIEQMVMRFHEPIDVSGMANAWAAAAHRHEVLRTAFRSADNGEPTQFVVAEAPMALTEIDQRSLTDERADSDLDAFLRVDRSRGFAHDSAPLSRLTIFHRESTPSVLVWTFHHIILDGRSFPIVLADVFAVYDAFLADSNHALPDSVPYRSFIDALEHHDHDASQTYWRTALAGFAAPTPLGIDGIGPIDADAGFGEIRHLVDGSTTAALDRLADNFDITVNTVIQGTWALLLALYSGESDIVFGTTRSGRYGTVPEAGEIAGLFINTLPLRVSVTPTASVGDWLRSIRAQHIAMRDHEHTPLVDVQAWSAVPSGSRLFDSILMFETYQLDPMLKQRTGVGARVDFELLEQTNHPLLLSAYGGDRLELRLEYDGTRISTDTARRAVQHFDNLLQALVDQPDATLGELDCLSAQERHTLTREWNSAPRPVPEDTSLVARWRHRVELSPAAIALVDGADSHTFADVDRRSDQLARALIGHGAGPDQVIGLVLDRSAESIISMLAVLKAGSAYLPLDPDYPDDRVRHMISDSGANLVLAVGGASLDQITALAPDNVTVALLESLEGDDSCPLPEVGPDASAYIIYTSGSTGTPKGVVVPHRGLVNHADGIIARYQLRASDNALQFAALSFDVAGEELYPTWLAGAAVVLRTADTATSFDELARVTNQHQVSVLNLPAAYWSAWVDHLASTGNVVPESVRLVIAGSEKVPTSKYRRWVEVVDTSIRWLNAYGPTEATITSSVFDPAESEPPPGEVMPIGRPLDNVVYRVVDEAGRLTPIGVAGELLIGGHGVATGYHNRPELTAEKFIVDPFTEDPEDRLYRTGDLARWLPDGNVEFLGRADDQVKIRGFRIELGEIESSLRALDGVADAVVVAQPDTTGADQLIAHIVADQPGLAADFDVLRAALQQRLPAYMVPVGFSTIDSVPLAPSGKVDRRALPSVTVSAQAVEQVAPRTHREHQLAEIWSGVLGISDISVHDNFFDLGGNSLTAIQLFSTIQKVTGTQLTLPELFAAPSIAQLGAALDGTVEPNTTTALPSWVFAVKPTGSRPPLFHLGGASVLRTLAEHLPEEQPLYALLEQDFEAPHFFTSVAEIVPHCVAGIRAAQPEGPYLIAGLCFGGIVALEVSRALRAEGEEVALTVMIDSFAPGTADVRTEVRSSVDTSADHDHRAPIEAVIGTQATAVGAKRYPRFHPTRVVKKIQERAWRFVWGPLHQTFRRLNRPLPSWLRDVEEANTVAAEAYQARPYDGDVTLFRATENSDEFDQGPTNGWAPFITGQLHVDDVVGGHVTMYAEPKVANLALALQNRIDAALGPDTSPNPPRPAA